MAYCLRSFVETLDQVLNPHQHYKKWVLDHDQKPEIQSLFENATFLQNFLDKSSPQIQERISSLEEQIMDAAQKAADTLESYITDQILLNPEDQSFIIFPPDLGEVIRVFQDAKQEASNIKDASQSSNSGASLPVSSTRYPASKNMVVGVEEDLNQLRSRLTSARVTELDVIPIVGMGGIGKTTLARILYDEFSSKLYFDCCAWVTVTQICDPQQVLKTILACVTGKPLNEILQQQTSELIVTLYQTLVGRRYLIVLDDIWGYEAWDDVQRAFARENRGSRILFTTRENSLVDYVKSKSHEMNLINVDKSWELLRGKVFGDESCPPELVRIGNIIAKKCGGLPLALQVIGGLLAHSPISKDFWEYVAHNVSSLIATTNDHFAGIFSWSFGHLPHYLKPCFLYMGAFPEDYDILASRLIKMWVAEGFLYPVPNKSLEEAAEIHLNSLVDRNLIFVRTRRWNGKAKSYGVHDLLRDLCMRKAREMKFLYVKDSKTDILPEDILCLRRVSLDVAFADGSVRLTSLVRSFLLNQPGPLPDFYESWLCYKSSLLRVLDAKRSECSFEEVILHLVNLRYVDLSTGNYTPRGIYVLSNLQTLIVYYLESLTILEHLPQLRNLQFKYLENICSFEMSPHENLHRLSKVPIDDLTYYLLGKIPNLTKLGIDCLHSYHSVVDLIYFQKLESLRFSGPKPFYVFSINIIFPPSLKKLTLSYCRLSQTLVSAISILPELQFLKLHICEFENSTWEPSEGEFCQLQYLELHGSHLENWLATEIHFPVLRHLVIKYCDGLYEIPEDIGEIETLEVIELDYCKASVFDFARTIEEEKLKVGNTIQLRVGYSCEDVENEQAAELLKDLESKVQNHGLTIHGMDFISPIIMFPHSLKKLKLYSCVISKAVLKAIGVLPELEVLKLKRCLFANTTWEPSQGQFRQLQHLEISNGKRLFKLFATEIHFPVLEHLAIKECTDLLDIPIDFGLIKTLGKIEIEGCKPSLVNSANTLLEEQRELGNTLLQLQLHGELEETDEDSKEADIPESGSGRMNDLVKAFYKLTVPKLYYDRRNGPFVDWRHLKHIFHRCVHTRIFSRH